MSAQKTSENDHNIPSGIERVRRLLFANTGSGRPIELQEDGGEGVSRYIAELDQLQEDVTRAFLTKR